MENPIKFVYNAIIPNPLSLIMKKIILIFILLPFQSAFCQEILTEYSFKKVDTLVVIKLFKDSRVLFEEHPVQEIKLRENFSNTTQDEKKICGLQTLIYYQSYGTYELTDSNITLNFIDENPIEKVILKPLEKLSVEQKTIVEIIKNFDTFYDLSIYQKENELCNIFSFGEKCDFTIENTNNPLILDYNGYSKTVHLISEKNIELTVIINDLKGNNRIKNKNLIFYLNELTEK